MPDSTDISNVIAAVNRAEAADWRLLKLLAVDPSIISYREAHEAVIASILTHVAFIDLAKLHMRDNVPHRDRMHRVTRAYPSMTLENPVAKATAADYSWVVDGSRERQDGGIHHKPRRAP